jgi:hypothetical protein
VKFEIENQKIKNVIDELGEEYKDMLIEKAMSDFCEYDVNEISLPALLRHDARAKAQLSTDERTAKRSRLLSMTAIIGLLYTFIGLGIFLYIEYLSNSQMQIELFVAIISVFAGLMASLMSLVIKNLPLKSFRDKDASKYFNSDVVNQWKKIESLLIRLTPVDEDSSLNGMISHLTKLKLLSLDDVSIIKQLLQLRNQTVHSSVRAREYTVSELKAQLSEGSKIISKLKQYEEN